MPLHGLIPGESRFARLAQDLLYLLAVFCAVVVFP
jgi:hypothetical protein